MDQEQDGATPPPIGKQAADYDKEKRENLFRGLTSSPWTTGKTVGAGIALLVGLILLGSGSGAGILIGLALIGSVGWVIYVRRTGRELDTVPPAEILTERESAVDYCRADAMEVLHLDDDDIVQSVILTGGAPRQLIDGRRRDLLGQTRPDPMVSWVPWVRDETGQAALMGRVQIHNIFALQDGIAYHSKQYDLVDGEFVESFVDGSGDTVSRYATNKIYYRNVENVRMTEESLELHMTSGRSHSFGLTIPRETGSRRSRRQRKASAATARQGSRSTTRYGAKARRSRLPSTSSATSGSAERTQVRWAADAASRRAECRRVRDRIGLGPQGGSPPRRAAGVRSSPRSRPPTECRARSRDRRVHVAGSRLSRCPSTESLGRARRMGA